MKKQLHSIALAFTFSPTLPQLIKQAGRLRAESGARLCLIHAGIMSDENATMLEALLAENDIRRESCEIICKDTDAGELIHDVCKQKKIGLLIIGALMKEGLFSYYTGSLARDLMRQVPASMLILSCHPGEEISFSHVCATVDFSKEGSQLLNAAYETALMLKSEKLTFLREFVFPGLAITVHDSGAGEQTEQMRQDWEKQEMLKLEMFIKEMHLTGIPIRSAIVYGKQGFEAKCYAQENKVDLLVVPAPKKKLRLIDRIFQHDQEFLYQELPCSLLCVKIH